MNALLQQGSQQACFADVDYVLTEVPELPVTVITS